MLGNKERCKILSTLVWEGGFDYFNGRSFPEVKDEEFHILRKAYVKAVDDLKKYLGDLSDCEVDEANSD